MSGGTHALTVSFLLAALLWSCHMHAQMSRARGLVLVRQPCIALPGIWLGKGTPLERQLQQR